MHKPLTIAGKAASKGVAITGKTKTKVKAFPIAKALGGKR